MQRCEVPALRTKSLETLSHVAGSLAHALIARKYDVVHMHALAPGVFARICRLAGVPTVATVQGLDWQRAKWKGMGSRIIRFGERSIVKNVDSIIVVSRDLQRYFDVQYGRSTTYIPNGVEGPTPGEIDDIGILADFGLKPRQFLIYLGRLVPEKRIEDLLLAFKGVESAYKLVITGESGYTNDYVNHLRSLAAQDDRVLFTGIQPRSSVHTLLGNAAAYLSGSEIEGLPMSLLESMWHGTPAILSSIAPHRQLFEALPNYELFFETSNVAQIGLRMKQFLANQMYYRDIAETAREKILEEYSWPGVVRQTEDLFFKTVDTHIPGATSDFLSPRRKIVSSSSLRSNRRV